MKTQQEYLFPVQFEEIQQVIGPDLTLVFELLSTHLTHAYDTGMPPSTAARARAELREARRIVLQIRHPDPQAPVRREEMAWAIDKIIAASNHISLHPVIEVMRRIERMLGLDDSGHDIPKDMDKKIGNAVKVLTRGNREAESVVAA